MGIAKSIALVARNKIKAVFVKKKNRKSLVS
jgi:hypothetical protein